MPHTDTICAISTAQGGAIGVIRVSGPGKYSFDATIGNYILLNELKKRD